MTIFIMEEKELERRRREAIWHMAVEGRPTPYDYPLTVDARPSPHVEMVIYAVEAALLEVEKPEGVRLDCHVNFEHLRDDEHPNIVRDRNRVGDVYRVSILFYPQCDPKRVVFQEKALKGMTPCAEGVCSPLVAKLEDTDTLRIRQGDYLRRLASLYKAAFGMGVFVDGYRVMPWAVEVPEDFRWFQRQYGIAPDYKGEMDPEFVFFIRHGHYRSPKIRDRMRARFADSDALRAAHKERVAAYNARRAAAGGRCLEEEE